MVLVFVIVIVCALNLYCLCFVALVVVAVAGAAVVTVVVLPGVVVMCLWLLAGDDYCCNAHRAFRRAWASLGPEGGSVWDLNFLFVLSWDLGQGRIIVNYIDNPSVHHHSRVGKL